MTDRKKKIRGTADFSVERMKARRQWSNTFPWDTHAHVHAHTHMHTHTHVHMHAHTYAHACTHTHAHTQLLPWMLHPMKKSFKNKGEIEMFSHIQKLKIYITSRPALQEISKSK